MTDARLPERWLIDRRFLRLSDGAHRLYVDALMWSVSNRTDGILTDADLHLMPTVDVSRGEELAKAELWLRDADRWLIVDFANTQTSQHELEVLDNGRRRGREKKARQRAAKRADGDHQSDGEPGRPGADVPREVPPGQSPGTAQARTGQARPGLKTHLEEDQRARANDCLECQRRAVFNSGLCPHHAQAVSA